MILDRDSIARPIFSIIVAFFAISYYVTGNFTWGYETHWTDPRFLKFRFIDGMRNFTEAGLAQFDGRNPELPVYLAVDGMVFDVTAKRDTYGPYGPYGFFSGKDGARAFGTGCFKTDITHDLRDLDEKTLSSIKGWQTFFANHPKYWHIGYVEHPPLKGDPPAPCKAAQKPN